MDKLAMRAALWDAHDELAAGRKFNECEGSKMRSRMRVAQKLIEHVVFQLREEPPVLLALKAAPEKTG